MTAYGACEVCAATGPRVRWASLSLCPPCATIAIEWSPAFVAQRAAEAEQRHEPDESDRLNNLGHWLQAVAGEPIPQEPGQ